MDMNVHMFFKMTQKRKEHKQSESRPIGSAIKYQRKLMNMTLEEGSSGICSISYLSKLENNQIPCNPVFLEKLLDRFQITEKYDEPDPLYNEHLDKLIDHIIFNEPIDLTSYDMYKNLQDHQSLLVQLCLFHIEKDDMKVHMTYRDLVGFIPHLNDHELAVLSIVITENLYLEGRYKDGHDILVHTQSLKDLKHHVRLARTKWRLLHAFKMKNTAEVHMLYPKFMEEATQAECYELQKEIQRHLILFHAEHQHPHVMSHQLSSIKKIEQKDHDLLLATSYYYHQNYEKVIKLMKPYAKTDIGALNLFLMSLDHLGQKETILSTIDQIGHIKKPYPTVALIDHLKSKYTLDKSQLLRFLRTALLSLKPLPHDYQILEYLMLDGQQLFAKYQYYKEANQVINHIRPHLSALKKSQGKHPNDA